MNRRITLALGAAAGAMLSSAMAPVAIAFADTAVFPDAPGPDAFTLGDYTFDPYLNTSAGEIVPTVEGFNPLDQGTGTPGFFETGSSSLQSFEVFSPASGSTAATELGTVQTTENVTSYGSITNTGFDITGESPATGGSFADLPALGTQYDVTNFGNGFENIYTDVPGGTGGAGTVTDTLVTPFGDENLSNLVSAFDISSLNPGAAFGVNPDFAGIPAVAGTPGADAFTLGSYTFDPYVGDTIVTNPSTEGFNLLNQGTGTPGFFETGSGTQNFEVFSTASGSTTPTEVGSIGTTENVTSLFGITNTGFDVTGGLTSGSLTGLPADGTVYDVTNFGSGFENVYTDIPGAAGAAGTVTDTFVTPFGDYNLSDLVSAFDLSALDPGSAFGLGADAAGAAADAAGSIDPLSFLGL
jgi:hypothetical protein